ncbi:MAG: STAS domain-containing protein [Actinomycetota bacterium]|nr:STAS domain-containing protein [Actinomycetota bacterium]
MRRHTDATAGADAPVDQLISFGAREVGDSCLVTVAGEIDMVTTPNLRAFLQQQLEQAGSLLVIDLREVRFLGSSGLAVLVEVFDTARERHLGLRLVCNSREVTRPLEAIRLTELFDIHPDLDTALAPG